MSRVRFSACLTCLLLGVILIAACSPTTPSATQLPPTALPASPTATSAPPTPEKTVEKQVLLIASENSADMELMLTKEVGVMMDMLQKADFKVIVASPSGKPIVGGATTLKPDMKLADVKIDDYAGVIVPCMASTSGRPKPIAAVEIIKTAAKHGMPIAAQQSAVVFLGDAGVLDGKQFAIVSDSADLIPKGIYKGQGVVQDGNIITSAICPYMVSMGYRADGTAELTQKFIDTLKSGPVPAAPVQPTASPAAQVRTGPSPRGVFAMAYDTKNNQVLLYGGQTGNYRLSANHNGETWIYDVAANTWTEMKPPTSPGIRAAAELAYDIESDRFILFQGGTFPTRWQSDDVAWAYDLNTNTWTKMKAKGPVGHMGTQMAYDSESDRIILFSGYSISFDKYFEDTWAYDYNTDTWTDMKPAVSPPGRNFHSMTYDSKADRIILWGGDASTPVKNNVLKGDSIWAYDFNTNTWEERKTAPAPAGRPASAISYDAGTDRTILYGGFIDGSADTWAYDYNKNTWTEMKPGNNPGYLSWHEIVYAPVKKGSLLFGGVSGPDPTGNTWLYDFNANTWTEVTPNP